MRLLLVDDDDLIRASYESVLRDMGFEVETSERAEEALKRLTADRFDVVLSDIQMPGMSGVEFLKAIRQVDLDVPIILMTGAPTIASAIEAVEYGAFRYLPKPVDAATLEETVRRAGSYHALARVKRDALELTGGAARWPADRAALEGRFDQALERLWTAFQPIVSCGRQRVHAYECLLRSDEPSLSSPLDVLDAAEQLRRLSELGRAVRESIGCALPRIPADVLVFVNLHPLDLNDPQLLEREGPLAAGASRIVFEITERASLHNVPGLQQKVAALRALGYRLAVDDLGAGYAGLTSMMQLEPDYVKLDMALIRGIDHSPTQQKLVRSMVNLCQDLGKQVIAEGIEEPAERNTLDEMGCDLLQGYLFARPGRELPAVAWEALRGSPSELAPPDPPQLDHGLHVVGRA